MRKRTRRQRLKADPCNQSRSKYHAWAVKKGHRLDSRRPSNWQERNGATLIITPFSSLVTAKK